MLRAAIYARFSTDLQNERSTEDQIDLCRTYAQREGLQVVKAYQDKARSGASMIGRDGLMSMLQDAQAKRFDVILVEALDRLSRDMEDLAGIHKRMQFLGIQLRAVHEGTANTLMVGLRGLIGQLYREDNVHKIRRGMTGLVKQGLSAGGRAYGYRPDPANKGRLLIVEDEAAVVRRIFQEFAEGRSPRAIAHDLNRQGIRPPRGTKWNASTINGSATRENGILRNSIYAGRLVWNRVQMVKDPDTGKRVSRPNPPSDWQYQDVPDLQLVPSELWDRVQSLKRDKTQVRAEYQRRPKRMLSGLLRCGVCGAGMSTFGHDRTGRVRVRCSAAAESGSCPEPKTFYLEPIERAVLDTLARHLRDPRILTEYVEAYLAERKRLAHEKIMARSSVERKLAVAQRELDRLIDGYAKGFVSDEEMGSKVHGVRAERDRLREELAAQPEVLDPVTLHPAALKHFEAQLADLHKAVNRGIEDGEGKSASALRALVSTVTVHKDAKGQVSVDIRGELNALVGWEISDGCVRSGGSGGPLQSIRTRTIPFALRAAA